MGERSYLAIGDVLALLREEFPDITISKIRFLESRGLLVPERTPSGYRKFYEPDVERLRWILRQQREHFLPLKVIKGRLENGMTDPDAPTPQLFEMGDPPPERESQAVLVGAHGTAEASGEAPLQVLARVAAVASAGDRTPNRADPRVLASRETAPAAGRAAGPSPRGSTHGTAPGARQPPSGHRSPEPEEGATGNAGPSRSRRPRSTRPESSTGSQNATAEPGPAGEPGDEGRKDAGGPAGRASSRSTSGLPGAGLSGASLTLVELANASGLGVPGIEELESFGLIAGRTVAGVHCYDEEAVLVAKLAARFAPYGIEARHLKVFKHAADRQTGLFAQVVTPLLRQRNPEARARAMEDLSELAELGEALMRCFSQATLRELTGG
ncbi:MAG: MerR family transcriptional regulator [Acidimicrobiales bacterium]